MQEPDFEPEEMGPGLVGLIYVAVGAVIVVVGTALTGVSPTIGYLLVGLGGVVVVGAVLLAAGLWWTERRENGNRGSEGP